MWATADDGNVSILTKDGVTVYKEEDVLITCKRNPILIGKRDERGRYWIPLTKDHRQWQPSRPTKEAKRKLQQTHIVYDLTSKEQAIKWMHVVCGYPVKSMWIKAIKAGKYVGFPMLTECNASRYYPETNKTPKGHLNQPRKNVRSTKPKRTPLEVPKTEHYKDTRHVMYTPACMNQGTLSSTNRQGIYQHAYNEAAHTSRWWHKSTAMQY